MLDDLIAELIDDLELHPLKQDEKGAYLWPLENLHNVEIHEAEPSIFFYSRFAPAPKESLETFYTNALYGNLIGMGTEGAVLGVSPNADFLTLGKEIPNTLSYDDFRAEFESFLNTIDVWSAEAKNPAEAIE